MNAPTRTPVIGDNIKPLVTADSLAMDHADLKKLAADLEAKAKGVPPVIEDDDDLALVSEIVPKLSAAARKIDDARAETKRPHLDANKVIEDWFKGIENQLRALQAAIEKRGKAYLDKKRIAAEAQRQAEAATARTEAERLQAEAVAAMKAGDTAKVATAHSAAVAAEARAEESAAPAKASDLARTRTGGGTATLQEAWTYQIEDLSKVDLNQLRQYFSYAEIERAVGKFVRVNHDKRPLEGVRIFKDTRARFTS